LVASDTEKAPSPEVTPIGRHFTLCGVRLARPVRQVIFDLDGVLLDTEPLYTRSIAAVAARFGKGYDWTVKSQCIGRGTFEAADIIVRALQLPLSPEELVRERDLTLVGLLATAPAMPGAHDLTRALALRGVPMAIATSTEAALYAIKATPHREWLTIFRAVVCGDERACAAPSPLPTSSWPPPPICRRSPPTAWCSRILLSASRRRWTPACRSSRCPIRPWTAIAIAARTSSRVVSPM
jgi:hypothetical protein